MSKYNRARRKFKAGIKAVKQDIGSAKSQTRDVQAVLNHPNFFMKAATLTWIYADRLQIELDNKHKIRGRASFPFSDVRWINA